mgnify:FL=1
MKRKVMSVLMMFVLILSLYGVQTNAAADVCKISLSPKSSSVEPEKTVDIELKMSNITDADGLAAYSAKINFDTNVFTYSKITGYGEWETPTYNEGNIVATVASGNGQTTNQTFAILTLKVNSGVVDGNYKVSLSNITVSNGVDTLTCSPAEVSVKVAKKANTSQNNNTSGNNNTSRNDNTSGNNNTSRNDNTSRDNNTSVNNNTSRDNNTSVNNNTSKNNTITNRNTTSINASANDTTSPNKIPFAGLEKMIFPGIVIITIVGIVSYFRYKKYNIK